MNDIYDQTQKPYVIIRTLEKETFLLELDFAYQIVKLIEDEDEINELRLRQLNDAIETKAQALYKESIKKIATVKELLLGKKV